MKRHSASQDGSTDDNGITELAQDLRQLLGRIEHADGIDEIFAALEGSRSAAKRRRYDRHASLQIHVVGVFDHLVGRSQHVAVIKAPAWLQHAADLRKYVYHT